MQSPVEQKGLDKFIKENLTPGCICSFKLPMAVPCFFIKKNDGSLCLVQDHCTLNNIMVKNQYPLPLVLELIDCLKGACWFTKLDVQIRVEDHISHEQGALRTISHDDQTD
jgi:hypothetical protein